MSLCAYSLTEAAEHIREGRISSAELVQDCLARIDELEPAVQAWAFLDRDHALKRRRSLDLQRAEGKALGPLHGVDRHQDIFDTSDYATELGSPLWAAARRGGTLRRWRAARGRAVIMGKTVTTEYAFPSRQDAQSARSRAHPGGSSGSAAAVAAHMVPGAIGSQTNGSVIRPAAFCGVVGFKPTHGLIPRNGALALSRTLDQVGVFTRTVEDAALLAETLTGFDQEDPDTRPIARPPFAAVAASEPPLPPRFAFVRSPVWEQAEPATREAFDELVATLGDTISEVELASSFGPAVDWHRTIMEVEMAYNLHRDYQKGGDQLSAPLRKLIERAPMPPSIPGGRRHRAAQRSRQFDIRRIRCDRHTGGAGRGAART